MNTILANVLKAEATIDQMGSDRTNALDELAVHLGDEVQSRGVTIHTVWNDLFEGAGWAYKEYDATEDKIITVEGDKAPKRIQTYKSQSKKAFKTLDINTLTTWSQIKDEIKAVPTEEQERINAMIKALKEEIKSGNMALLEEMEKTLNA